MSPDLFDNFARIVKSFTNSSRATDVAEQCAALTSTEKSKPSAFTYCESNTWKLLATLASCKNKSTLHRYAIIKQWVSKILIDQNLLDKIKQEDLLDQELEEELNFIVSKNRVLRSPSTHTGEERPTKIRRRDQDTIDQEALFKKRYKQLRAGNLTCVGDENDKSLGYVYNEYIKYSQLALENVYSKINQKERSTWREYILHMSKDESLGKYGKALYYTLGGNISDLCALKGQTWEDVIWAYVNGREQDMMDSITVPPPTEDKTPLLDQEISQLALQKDKIMDKNDPRILFHQVQIAILSNTTQQLISRLHQGYIKNQWSDTLCMTKEVQAQLLRFISTWILFGRVYLGWKVDKQSTELLAAYTELNAQAEAFRPIVIASYAAKLPGPDQVSVFSKFLQDFDGDQEECAIILKLGKEYELDMHAILLTTNTNLLKRAIANASPLPPKPSVRAATATAEFEIEAVASATTDEQYDLFFRSLHWLLLDTSLALQAVESANEIMRYFFSLKKLYLVKQVFDLIPESTYEMIVLTGRVLPEIIEFDLHRQVMLVFMHYQEWFKLVQSKPEDNGKLVDLQNIYKWRDEVERQTSRLEEYMKTVLEGNWLGKDAEESQITQKDTLRRLYLPEILIRYHNVLHLTSTIIAKNEEKTRKLNVYLTSEHKELFDDVRLSKRMPDVIKQFSRSLFSDDDSTPLSQ